MLHVAIPLCSPQKRTLLRQGQPQVVHPVGHKGGGGGGGQGGHRGLVRGDGPALQRANKLAGPGRSLQRKADAQAKVL